MTSRTHIIHKLIVEVETPDEPTAIKVKDDMAGLLQTDVLPALEKYLDSLKLGDDRILIDKLSIDVGNISAAVIEEELEFRVMNALKDVIGKIPFTGDEKHFDIAVRPRYSSKEEDAAIETFVEKESIEENILRTFLYFLETGRMPWWNSCKENLLSEEKLEKVITQSFPWVKKSLILLFRESEVSRERLLLQFPDDIIIRIIAACISTVSENIKVNIAELHDLIERFKKNTEHILSVPFKELEQDFLRKTIELISISEEAVSNLKLQGIFEQVRTAALERSESKVTPNLPEKAESSSTPKKAIKGEEDGIFVLQAGLVLLHPFLEYFFLDFDLLENGKFKDATSQVLAVHLLHYLATKQERPMEYELTLEKYLCGWDLDKLVEREILLTQPMKDESEKLLTAAIKNWKALKNTSPDGLREGFLQREGKLVINGFQNRLIVENKAQDVLLSSLPWGIGIIKLPWLEQVLFVEWNY